MRWSEAEDQIPEEAVVPGRIGLRFAEVRTKGTVRFGDDYGNIMYLSRDGTHNEGNDPPPLLAHILWAKNVAIIFSNRTLFCHSSTCGSYPHVRLSLQGHPCRLMLILRHI